MIDLALFGIFPYAAVAVALAGILWRWFGDRYSWSSQSSQFLEGRQLFWGSVTWHFAILAVLAAHLLALLFPAAWGELAGRPIRLYLLEATGLALGVVAAIGLVLLIYRRATTPRVAVTTTGVDWLLLAVLLLQVVTGIWIAFTMRWGSVWYLHTAVPWLWSLLRFDPQVQFLAVLPPVVKIHAVNAFVLVALLPFSRLAHALVAPIGYLWRPAQVVIWNRRQAAVSGKR